jgi:3-oxoadipate enol-lactonase
MTSTYREVLPSGIELHVRIDDFTDPWMQPEVVLMLHGTAETGEAFRQWTPWLARHFRVVTPDLRGMGESSALPAGQPLEMAQLVQDAHALMQSLGVARYYVVGEKVGSLIGFSLAGAHPDNVLAMSVSCGMVAPCKVLGPWIPEWIDMIGEQGVGAWVDATQAGRMGDELSPEALGWWSRMMAGSMTREGLVGYQRMLSRFELDAAALQAVRCPVQFLVPAGAAPSDGRYDQRRPQSEATAWRQWVPNHRVSEIEGTSYHLSATHPDACAMASRDFFRSLERQPH